MQISFNKWWLQGIDTKIRYVLLIMTFFFISLWGTFSLAGEDDSSIKQTQLETITVTADKREENVQKVTTSITVLSDVEIEDAGIASTKDIWQYVPNLTTSSSGSRDYFSMIRMRGLSNTAFGEPSVALYIDDVSYAGIYAFDNSLFDIERIEILKGPQGTLYGKNTEGGVINIVSKIPDNIFQGRLGLEIGDYSKKGITASITGPLMQDKLFFKISAKKSAQDGYIENKINDEYIDNQDTFQTRLALIFTPNEKLNFDLNFRWQDYDDDGGFPVVPMERSRFLELTGVSLDEFQAATDYIGESSSENNTTSLRTRYHADKFDIISVTAYRDMDNESTLDGDFTPADMASGFNSVESGSFSQELRMQSKNENDSFKWLVGAYYGKDDKEYNTGYRLGSIYAEYYEMPIGTEDAHQAQIDSEDMALFVQSTIRFMDNKLGLTAGLRYEHSESSMDHEHFFGGVQSVDPIYGMEKTNSELLPKLVVDYRINENSMSYASISRGYKAGGFAYAVDNPEIAAFDPEISTAFELGWKNELPQLGLRVNVATFYTIVDDYQDRVQIDQMTVTQENVSEADIYGFELELAYTLTKEISLNGFLGYTHSEYGEYIDPLTGENYEGNAIATVPEYDSGLFLEYRNALGLFARAGIQHIGTMYFERTNKKKQGSYTLYNAKIGYEQENWEVYLAAKNLTNEQYFLEGYEDPNIGYAGAVGKPRNFCINFNYRF